MAVRPFYYTWNFQPASDAFVVDRAEHDEFVLRDGRRVYDFISTSFQAGFGHSHPMIREAIHRQVDAMPIASPKSTFDLKERVSRRLIELLGLPGGKLFYTVSGSEAVENALKMARQLTGRTKILARRKSYHGASLGALSVTGDWRNAPHFTLREHTIRIPEPGDDPQLSTTRQIVAEAGANQIAAVIVETISGVNGVAIPSRDWLDGLATLCQENDILFISDEVLCGFGRTGPTFAFQHYGMQPDLVCMSKAITGGYVPFGAVWTGPRVTEYYDRVKLSCGLTNYAHPLGLAALEAVMDLLADAGFMADKRAIERLFTETLLEIGRRRPLVKEVRISGLLAAIELHENVAPSWQAMFDAGLHAFSNENTIVLGPPFVSTPERLAHALSTLQELIRKAA
jgi:taurine--2-oxoglutarate transaminase